MEMFSIWKRCLNNQNRMLERLIGRFDTKIYGGKGRMKDLCATCDIAEKDYDPSDPEYFCCSDCSCYQCIYIHCCEGQCAEEGAD